MVDDASLTPNRSNCRVVIGLGNPGDRYIGTRHNVGFDAVERAALVLSTERAHSSEGPLEWREEQSSGNRWHSFASVGSRGPFLLVKPMTYMNRSGTVVRAIFSEIDKGPFSNLDLRDCLVVVDDLAIPPGNLRLRSKGSDGGHNGLKSLISSLETSEFPRLRIGVGSPKEANTSTADYVLGRPESPEEKELLAVAVACATEAIILWVAQEPLATLMNRFNGKVAGLEGDGSLSGNHDSEASDSTKSDRSGQESPFSPNGENDSVGFSSEESLGIHPKERPPMADDSD